MNHQESIEYFQQRERMEREAAKNAGSPAARRVHQELAQGYAALARPRTEGTLRLRTPFAG